MMTNMMAGIAVRVSPSHGKYWNCSRPMAVSNPLSRPRDGSYICAHSSPMMIAGIV